METETPKAFRAFRTYLQSPPERRSLRNLIEEDFAWGSLSRWSQEHAWQSRAVAFDTSVASAGLDRLLGARESIFVAAMEGSFADAAQIRAEFMKHVPGALPERLVTIQEGCIENDVWIHKLSALLRQLGERDGGE